MLAALAQALEERDAYSGGHSLRVTALAETIGERLAWGPTRRLHLRIGALLHDVGKLAVSERVLRKAGPLDEEELAQIQAHPVAGVRLAAAIAPERTTLACVLYHHERWDGGGYPSGRRGAAIPLEARVLAVVDAFDAMTSARPYREALELDAALEELERCAGSQFDPGVAGVFLQAWAAGEVQDRRAAAAR
jgi:HD-GYP domain-containing protein (c-di-GMP phosphodiesterase class II)